MPTWIARGPGNDWQIAMASRICSLVSHLRSLTSSRSICPTSATGPPKPRNPRRRKYRTNSLIRPLGTVVVMVVMSCPARCLNLAARLNQYRFADAEWERQRLFEPADQRQYHQEMQEIICGTQSAQDQPRSFGGLASCKNEKEAVSHQDPEEDPVDRSEAGRTDRTGVEPRYCEQHQNRPGHCGYTKQLVRNRFQDGVERHEVPLRHDICRRHARIGGDRIIGVEQSAWLVDDEPRIDEQEGRQSKHVLDRVVGMERDRVLRFGIDALRIIGTEAMQCNEMQENNCNDHERQQVMQRVESIECGFTNAKAAQQPRDDTVADNRDRREQICDHRGTPEAHLAPG